MADRENELEAAIRAAQSGALGMAELLPRLARATLAVPSADEVLPNGSEFRPILFQTKAGTMVACFTSRDMIGDFAQQAPYCLMIPGRAFFKRLPKGHGVVLNPGHASGLELTPEGVANVVAEGSHA